MEFEVVDRRGKNKVDEPKEFHSAFDVDGVQDVSESTVEGSKDVWKSVSYCIQIVQTRPAGRGEAPGFIALGSAVGLRGDGIPFVANYVLPQPTWEEGCKWEEKAKKRLDTYLGCDCIFGHPCAIHKMYIKDWEKADQQRLELQGTLPVPEPIEAMFKAQQEHLRSRIEEPRG